MGFVREFTADAENGIEGLCLNERVDVLDILRGSNRISNRIVDHGFDIHRRTSLIRDTGLNNQRLNFEADFCSFLETYRPAMDSLFLFDAPDLVETDIDIGLHRLDDVASTARVEDTA